MLVTQQYFGPFAAISLQHGRPRHENRRGISRRVLPGCGFFGRAIDDQQLFQPVLRKIPAGKNFRLLAQGRFGTARASSVDLAVSADGPIVCRRYWRRCLAARQHQHHEPAHRSHQAARSLRILIVSQRAKGWKRQRNLDHSPRVPGAQDFHHLGTSEPAQSN